VKKLENTSNMKIFRRVNHERTIKQEDYIRIHIQRYRELQYKELQ